MPSDVVGNVWDQGIYGGQLLCTIPHTSGKILSAWNEKVWM